MKHEYISRKIRTPELAGHARLFLFCSSGFRAVFKKVSEPTVKINPLLMLAPMYVGIKRFRPLTFSPPVLQTVVSSTSTVKVKALTILALPTQNVH
jgi:hypothetical protein